MRRVFLKGVGAVLALTSVFSMGGVAQAEDAKEFYSGNIIKWIVPYKPGGGYDEYSRLLAPYMEKYTGARVDIVNMPGAGGMKGANEIFNSPADGLSVGIINGSAMVTNELSEIAGANYKVADYNFLGRVVADVRVLVMGTNSDYKSFEDVQASGEDVLLGATGLGGSTYVDAVLTGPVFGLKQRVIHGFNSSSDVRQALLRGDIAGMWGSLGSAVQGVEDGDHLIVVQSARERSAALPDVPSIFEFAADMPNSAEVLETLTAWDALNAVGRPVAAPPGVPEDRLTFLREAFEKSITDPEFVELAESSDRAINYLGGAEMNEIAKAATSMSPETEATFVAAIRGEL